MHDSKRQALLHIESVINHQIKPLLSPAAVVTILIRLPGNPEATAVVTGENPNEYGEAAEAFCSALKTPNRRPMLGEDPL